MIGVQMWQKGSISRRLLLTVRQHTPVRWKTAVAWPAGSKIE
jgi:hypothetical protein